MTKTRQLRFICFALFVWLVATGNAALNAAEVAIKVRDSLGRAVPGAQIELSWHREGAGDKAAAVKLASFHSDADGNARASYDAAAVPEGKTVWTEISKAGFSGYTLAGVPSDCVLRREFTAADVTRIAALAGEPQISELREFLAGDIVPFGRPDTLLFVHEHTVRPALRALLTDPNVRAIAAEILGAIGEWEDVKLLLDLAPATADDRETKRLPNAIVSALVQPESEREWAFLRRCALDHYDAPWIASGAITSVMLAGSRKGLEILKAARQAETVSPVRIRKAIDYLESAPPRLFHADLKTAGLQVARAMGSGELQDPGEPILNERGDKALLHLEFISGIESAEYMATFHHRDGVWKLRALRLRTLGTVIRR